MLRRFSVAIASLVCLFACASGDLDLTSDDVAERGTDTGRSDTSGRPSRDTGASRDVGGSRDTGSDVVSRDVGADSGSRDLGPSPRDTARDAAASDELSIQPLTIQEDATAVHLGALDRGTFEMDTPLPDCSAPSGLLLPVNGYRIVNPYAEPVVVTVSLRTAAEDPAHTLPTGRLFAFDDLVFGHPGAMCSRVGVPAEGYASQLEDVTVPGLGAVGVLVAGVSPGVVGNYSVVIDRGEATPPDELPDPETICLDTCTHARNFMCNDGGPGSLNAECEYGTDCADCGERLPEG